MARYPQRGINRELVFSPIKFQADMGILLAFMFLWNMLGALILLPALAYFLLPNQQPAGETFDDFNPYDGALFAKVPKAGVEDIDRVMAAAFEARKGWATTPPRQRAQILYQAARILEQEQQEFAEILIKESGSTLGKAMFEISQTVDLLETAAADSTPEMKIYYEETFGPVASVIAVDNAEEAVAVANDTEYGLSAGVLTSDSEKALYLAEAVEAGMVHVNDGSIDADAACPFGGCKSSGQGREGGQYSLREFTEVKWVTMVKQKKQLPF